MILCYNNKFIEETSLEISPKCSGFNFGEGFFTTIKVVNGKIEHYNLHIERVKRSLKFFNFQFKTPEFSEIILKLLKENQLNSARVKITIFKDIDSVSYIIFCNKLQNTLENHNLQTPSYIRGNDPIFKYKSLNYYSNLKGKGTLFIDFNNRVLETGIANIFFIENKKIYTPSGNLSLLNGVYREYLLRGSFNNFEFIEDEIYLSDLAKFQAAFITNSIRGIEPILKINSINYNPKPVFKVMDAVNG